MKLLINNVKYTVKSFKFVLENGDTIESIKCPVCERKKKK